MASRFGSAPWRRAGAAFLPAFLPSCQWPLRRLISANRVSYITGSPSVPTGGSLQLIGMLDSPYVRRVAISLQILGRRFSRSMPSCWRAPSPTPELPSQPRCAKPCVASSWRARAAQSDFRLSATAWCIGSGNGRRSASWLTVIRARLSRKPTFSGTPSKVKRLDRKPYARPVNTG